MPTLIAERYEVLEALGRHAAGAIYKVRHPLLDSVLVVTVLSGEFTADAERLAHVQRAARAALRLRHDHIVPVLDFGQDEGRYYLVEAFVGGTRLAPGPLPAVDALHVARQLADALAHAHEAGVVHGAIGSACVLVEPGTPPRAFLTGFGLVPAPLAGPDPEAGTVIEARTDVFALGLLLYEMLEGKPFFSGSTEETAARLRDAATPLLPTFSRIVPSGVSALVARAIRHA